MHADLQLGDSSFKVWQIVGHRTSFDVVTFDGCRHRTCISSIDFGVQVIAFFDNFLVQTSFNFRFDGLECWPLLARIAWISTCSTALVC